MDYPLLRSFVHCVFVFLFFFLVPSTGDCLTLAEALSLVASHPAVVAREVVERQAAARAEDAGKRGPDRLNVEVENFSGGLSGFSRAESTLSFQRALIDGRRVAASRKVAALNVTEARLETERQHWLISSAVQEAFHQVLILRDLVGVAQEGELLAQKLSDITRARADSGAAPESEILKAELEVNRLAAERKKVDGQLAIACNVLARELSLADVDAAQVIGTLTSDLLLPSEETLLAHLATFHPELKSLGLVAESAAVRLGQLRAENRSALALTGGVRDYRDEKKLGFVMALEIELPNHQGSAGERKALALEQERVNAERLKMAAELKNLLREAMGRFETNRRLAQDLKIQILPSSLQILELALEAYRLGKTNQLSVLEAQKAVLDNWRSYFDTLGQMYVALNAIERLCGDCLVQEKH